MTLKAFDFDGGTNTSAVTTGLSSPDALNEVISPSSGSITYQSAAKYKGGLGGRVPAVAVTTTDNWRLRMDDTAAASFAVRAYLRLGAYPSAEMDGPIRVTSSAGSHLVRTQILTGGTIRVVGGATNGAASAGTVPLTQWCRWEFTVSGLNGAAGSATVNVYDADSMTVLATATLSGFTTAALGARGQLSKNSNATFGQVDIDDFAIDGGTSVEIGPTPAEAVSMAFSKALTIGV